MQFDLLNLLRIPPIREQIQRIRAGLKMPKDSGEYKWARYAMMRIFGPSSISMVSTALIILIATIFTVSEIARPSAPAFEATMIEPTKTDLDKLKVEEDKPPEELPTEENPDRPDLPAGPVSEITTPGPTQDYSSNPDAKPDDTGSGVGGDLDVPVVPFAAVMTKSPVIMKGLYGNRTKGGRENALRAYGGGGGSGGMTEGAVLRALRWLKKYQEADGSWNGRSGGGGGGAHNGAAAAMTGLAMLTFLAHGETPASAEFGATVEKGIKWLVEHQGADGAFTPKPYEHPMATYAVCEAYSMTKLPSLLEAAKKGIDVIIKGQNPAGGFNYELVPCDRNDSSVMGWCGQALKAGKIAGLDNEGLDNAMKKTIDGFKGNYQGTPDGGNFGYTGPGVSPWTPGGLTGVGVLCNQLLGTPKSPEAKGGLGFLAKDVFNWDTATWKNVYYWYYNTQAKFHEGGEGWKAWNKAFSLPLVKAQTIIPKAIEGPGGKMYDIGYWNAKNDQGGYTMDTTLCALMLQVYYRYLPTFQKPPEEAQAAAAAAKPKSEDIKIEVVK